MKVKVVDLKRNDVSLELQAKYFVNNEGHLIDRFHLPKLTEEMYAEYILSLPKEKLAKLDKDNRQFNTASYYYKDKASKELVAKDFGVSSKNLNFKGYTKKESWYTHYSTDEQILEEINPFRTPSVRVESESYAIAAHTIDKKRLDTVYDFCKDVIKQHKVILFTDDLEEAFYCARKLLAKITVGNVSKKDVDEFTDYESRLAERMHDSEFVKFLQNHNDEDILNTFDDPKDKISYLETYRKLYRDIGLDFTETKLWNKHITTDLLDYFEETEDIVNWRKDITEYDEDDWEAEYYEFGYDSDEEYHEEEGDEE